jgi:glycerol-3-phosphate acyltransferase PlsX
MTSIPNRRAFTQLLDVGANLRATPVQLRQFAIMGAIVARDVHGRERPRVGLLNIGEEETKGHDLVQEAHALLKDLRVAFEYVGFVEGQDIFSGEVDVVVTDGFTGNVALKTMEGVAGLIGDRLKREFTADLPSKLAGLAARPVLKRVSGSLDPRRYNGAIMVGLKHIVVKSHGSADRYAMAQAIAIAATAVRKQLVQHVSQALGSGDHSTC